MARKLIYIMGAGRSGTTLLDIMLGNNSNAISLGEINRFYKRQGVPPNRDLESDTYVFWEGIRTQLNSLGHSDLLKLYKLFDKNEYHTALFKSIFKLNNNKYKKFLVDMYLAILQNTNSKTIVESSKYPLRALNVSSYVSNSEIEICYIYLKKDPVSVVSSFQKTDIEQPRKNFLAANFYYFIVNLLCAFSVLILKYKGHKITTIRYEDLIENPIDTLCDIQEVLDLNQKDLIEKIKNNKSLDTGILFDGNRIRLNESIILKKQTREVKKSFVFYFTRVFNYLLYN